MATYIILANFTDQGIRNVKDTVKRSEAFKDMAGKKDVKVRDLFWTLGAYDIVAIVDAPNDEAITGIGLTLGMQGNVRTQTLRAYNAGEIGKILGKVG
ncbi:MAG TPA: GYD domain-containing protein [Aestuariivirgaceae bacterium]|nr:GYD domain-containing protein [Aestuariivirgaceae bacterium]